MQAYGIRGKGRPGWSVAAVAGTAVATVIALAGAARAATAVPSAVRALARSGGVRGAPGKAPGTISTIAGGPGGPGKAIRVGLGPCGLAAANGRFYIADGASVRQVSRTDWLTTPAGSGTSNGSAGTGGLATDADLQTCGAAKDRFGNLVIAEENHFLVAVAAARTGTFYGQAMTAGNIYTVAGTGTRGVGGSGVAATQTALDYPTDVTVDHHGNLVIADSGNYQPRNGHRVAGRLRVVAVSSGYFYHRKMVAGDIYTVAGFDKGFTFSGDGGPATKAGVGVLLAAVRVGQAGNLILAGFREGRVRVVAAKTGTFYGQAMTAGDIYTVAGDGTYGFSGDGGPATAAQLSFPLGVAVDRVGNLLIADSNNQRIRVVAASTGAFYRQAMMAGDIYSVAGDGTQGYSGDGGPATMAQLNAPNAVAIDSMGNLLISDGGNGRVRAVAASTGTFYGTPMTAGDIYTVAGIANRGLSGNGGRAATAEFGEPTGVAVNRAGNLAIADVNDNTVRFVPASTGTFYGKPMTAGHIYEIASDGIAGNTADGGLATKAELNNPEAVAFDGAGNLLIAEHGGGLIRLVPMSSGSFYGQTVKAGHIYTVATFEFPTSVAVDAAGNVVISGLNSVAVLAASTGTFYGKPMTAGGVYTVAGTGLAGFSGDGGPAVGAELNDPSGVALDGSGNLLIADAGNERVRVVADSTGTFYGQAMAVGDIYEVAGDGTGGFSGDGGPATNAELNDPEDVAVDGAGNVLVSDSLNDRVRMVAESAGTFYGQTVTAGDIYTVAGDGIFGFSGDGGPATSAGLAAPSDVAVDAAGNLVIVDTGSGRVRLVTG